jgi:Rho GDP-dissociation inhibitor
MDEEELAPTNTTGYKAGDKKTVEELAQLDAQDGIVFF